MSFVASSLIGRKIQVGGSTDISRYVTGFDVKRRENALNTASFSVGDAENAVWTALADVGTQLQIYVDYKSVNDPPTTYVFNGYLDEAMPSVSSNGAVTVFKSTGIGRSLTWMTCGEEYGVESRLPALDTLLEIIDNATDGIVPAWVEKILGTATVSGHTLGSTTYVADIKDAANPIQYLYYPFKSALSCLNDLMDVASWMWSPLRCATRVPPPQAPTGPSPPPVNSVSIPSRIIQ
jgi:hypothetical protein